MFPQYEISWNSFIISVLPYIAQRHIFPMLKTLLIPRRHAAIQVYSHAHLREVLSYLNILEIKSMIYMYEADVLYKILMQVL